MDSGPLEKKYSALDLLGCHVLHLPTLLSSAVSVFLRITENAHVAAFPPTPRLSPSAPMTLLQFHLVFLDLLMTQNSDYQNHKSHISFSTLH